MKEESLNNKKISLKTTVLFIFTFMAFILISVLGIQLFYIDKELSIKNIDSKLETISYSVKTAIDNSRKNYFNTIEILSISNKIEKEKQDENFKLYINTLKTQNNLYAIYTGYNDGSFFEIINLDVDKNLRQTYNATKNDKYLLMKIDGKKIEQRELVFFDEALNITTHRFEDSNYNATLRPWYKDAISNKGSIKTAPYKFSHIDTFGITYSKELENSKNVVSIDVLVDDFKNIFESFIDKKSMDIFLFQKDGFEISSISKNSELLKEFLQNNKNIDEFKKAKIIKIDNKKYIVQVQNVENLADAFLVLFADYKKTIEPYNIQTYKLISLFLLSGVIMIPLIIYFSRVIVKPIHKLSNESKKIKNREYEKINYIDSSILEVSILSNAFNDMAKSIYEYQTSLEEKVNQRTKELSLKNEELLKISITDKLTNIYNRVKLDSTLQDELNRALRYNKTFSIILIDIDFFKKVNDNFGHQVGDDVLKETAQILKNSIRVTDILGRWGGEEFLIICPETELNGAFDLATKLNIEVKNNNFTTYFDKVTLSIGVASFSNDIKIYDTLIANADKALYQAKNEGRDRVIAYKEEWGI
ncbi:GGDEF domain-containing protein [Arcobacter vandammei]|uniref:GGDEF domain-containing protein n=1 Tax=Arcobacter vandammei TaxID=2782243 RepID=UPI0018DF1738|nr:GGDEF domain-containing protein [Arcobacter vandammei]